MIRVTSYRNDRDKNEEAFSLKGKPYRVELLVWKHCSGDGIDSRSIDIMSLATFSNQTARFRELVVAIVGPMANQLLRDKDFVKQGKIADLHTAIRNVNRNIKRQEDTLRNYRIEQKRLIDKLSAL
jgi:hypothetical protein